MRDHRHAREFPNGRNYGWTLADIGDCHRVNGRKLQIRRWRKAARRALHVELARCAIMPQLADDRSRV